MQPFINNYIRGLFIAIFSTNHSMSGRSIPSCARFDIVLWKCLYSASMDLGCLASYHVVRGRLKFGDSLS